MTTLQQIAGFLQECYPLSLAAPWDNVGLLVGNPGAAVRRVMVCLSVTPESVEEAADGGAELIISHHPFPFHPLRRVAEDEVEGRLLTGLIRSGIAVYSPHTAFDSARRGINQQLAEGLQLDGIVPLVPAAQGPPDVGTGRMGTTRDAPRLDEFAQRVKSFLAAERVEVVGSGGRRVARVAIGCGSAGELLDPAAQAGCDCLVLGEARLHTCLEAEARGVGLVLAGHFASEQFALPSLAAAVANRFPELHAWTCRSQRDPLRTV